MEKKIMEKNIMEKNIMENNIENISFGSQSIPGDSFIPGDSSDFGVFRKEEDIIFSIEKIKIFGNLKVQLNTNFVIVFLPIFFIFSNPNFANAKNSISQQEKMQFSNFKEKTEIEEKVAKKIVVIELDKETKISEIDEEITENSISLSQNSIYQGPKLNLSNKKEGISHFSTTPILAKTFNYLAKQEKNPFNFSIKWFVQNKVLIFSFTIGILIFSLAIYYGFHKNNIFNFTKETPILTPPKELHFDCVNQKIDLNNQKKQFIKLAKFYNKKAEYFKQNGKRLYPDKIKYAKKYLSYIKSYKRLIKFKKALEKRTIFLDSMCS